MGAKSARFLVTVSLLIAAYWLGLLTGHKASSQRVIPEEKPSASQAVRALFLDSEVVKQVLCQDVNGDGRPERVVLIHDYFQGYPPSLLLCVLKQNTGGKLSVARKITLGEPLILDQLGDCGYKAPLDRGAILMDVNGDGLREVVVPAGVGDHTTLCIVALRGKDYTPITLYSQPSEGVNIVRPKRREDPWQIAESWCVWHLYSDKPPPPFRGHVLARKVYEWSREKGKFILTTTQPDLESERALTSDELRHIPGADILLKDRK